MGLYFQQKIVYFVEYYIRIWDVGFLGLLKCGGFEERICMSYFVESILILLQIYENLRYD